MHIFSTDFANLAKHIENPVAVPHAVSVYLWEHDQGREALTAFARTHFPRLPIEELATRSDKRFVEQLSIRLMLARVSGGETKLAYHPTGRPYLLNSPRQLSISHTRGVYALSLSDVRHGLDVEQWGDRALRVSAKFLMPSERQLQAELSAWGSPAQIATTLWSAKEAAYKFFDCPDTNIHDDILLLADKGIDQPTDTFTLRTRLLHSGEEAHIICKRLPQCVVTCCKSLQFSIK